MTAWRRAAGGPICARSQVCQKRRRKLDDQAFPRTKWGRCADHVGPADGGSALPTCWPTHSPDPAQSCGRMCSTFLSTCDRTGSGRLSRQGGRAPLPAASDPSPIRVPDAGLSRRSGVSKRRCTRPNGDGETLDPPQDSSASCYSSLHFGRFEWQVEAEIGLCPVPQRPDSAASDRKKMAAAVIVLRTRHLGRFHRVVLRRPGRT